MKTMLVATPLILVLVAISAKAQQIPTHAELIACFPESMTSVQIWHYQKLTGAPAGLLVDTRETFGMMGGVPKKDSTQQIDSIVGRAVRDALPVLYAGAGKDFEATEVIGEGNYNGCHIWYVETSLKQAIDELTRMARDRHGVQVYDIESVTVFEGQVSVESGKKPPNDKKSEIRYAAFPSDTCVVVAEDKESVEHIIHGLSDRAATPVPDKWMRIFASLNIDDPVIVGAQVNQTRLVGLYRSVGAGPHELGATMSFDEGMLLKVRYTGQGTDRLLKVLTSAKVLHDSFDTKEARNAGGADLIMQMKLQDGKMPRFTRLLFTWDLLFGRDLAL